MPSKRTSANLNSLAPKPEARAFSTGIPSLDRLFEGQKGIGWVGERPPSILVLGPPGAGKTVLCSQIAAAVFRGGDEKGKDGRNAKEAKGRPSVAYFAFEQFVEDHIKLLEKFEWGVETVPDTSLEIEAPPALSQLKPAFLISQYPATFERARKENELRMRSLDRRKTPEEVSNEHLSSFLTSRFQAFADAKLNLSLVVLDSLPDSLRERAAGRGTAAEFDMRRSFFTSLCITHVKGMPPVPIIIALEKAGEEVDWREFVADVVIELGSDVQAKHLGHPDRFLTIKKSRNQYSRRARHSFRILPRKGLVLYENPTEALVQQRAMESAETPAPASSNVVDTIRFSTITGMEKFMRRSEQAETIPAGNIIRGSSTLLVGEDRTRKNGIATSFIAAAYPEPQTPDAQSRHIYLVAGQTRTVAYDMLRWYWPRVLERSPEKKGRIDAIPIERCVEVISVDEYGETPGELLSRLREKLQWLKAEPMTARAVVNDLAAIPHQQQLVPMLKALFGIYGVTSLFVQTRAPAELSEYRDDFDNTIVARHMALPDGIRRAITYRLYKYQGASPVAPLWELRVRPDQLALEDGTLRHCAQGADGELTLPEVEIILFAEHVDAKDEYAKVVESIFGLEKERSRSVSGAPKIIMLSRNRAELTMESLRMLNDDYPLQNTQVLCIDDPWAEEMMNENKLEDLSQLFLESDQACFHPSVMEGCRKSNGKQGPLFLIPHHVDFGFYVVDSAFAEYLGEKTGRTVEETVFSWQTLAQEAGSYAEKHYEERAQRFPDAPNIGRQVLFDITSGATDETFLCFVLEIIKPLLDLKRDDIPGLCLDLQKTETAEAVCQLTNALARLKLFPGQPSPATQQVQTLDGGGLALIQRHWFVSFHRMLQKYGRQESEFRLIQPPSLELPRSGKSVQAQTLKGDWFLGIIKNSPSPERGAWAIRSLTSDSANHAMLNGGFGLPTRLSILQAPYYKNEMLGRLMSLYNESRSSPLLWSRRAIPSYSRIRSVLIDGFYEVFRQARSNVKSGQASGNFIDQETVADIFKKIVQGIETVCGSAKAKERS